MNPENGNDLGVFVDGVSNKIGEKVKSLPKKGPGAGDFKMHKKLGQGVKVN